MVRGTYALAGWPAALTGLADWLGCLAGSWLAGCLAGCLRWLAGWLADCLPACLAGWLSRLVRFETPLMAA